MMAREKMLTRIAVPLQTRTKVATKKKISGHLVARDSFLQLLKYLPKSPLLEKAKNELLRYDSDEDIFPFEEFPARIFWTARITFKKRKFKKDHADGFYDALLQTAKEMSRNDPYIFYGFFTTAREDTTFLQYNFTNHTHDIDSFEDKDIQNQKVAYCRELISHLQMNLRKRNISNTASIIEGSYEDKHKKNARIVLGLKEEVRRNRKMIVHTKNEVREALALLGKRVEVIDANIFWVGSHKKYEEKAVVIYAQDSAIPYIYLLAYAMRKKSFAIEYFSNQERSFTVKVRNIYKEEK